MFRLRKPDKEGKRRGRSKKMKDKLGKNERKVKKEKKNQPLTCKKNVFIPPCAVE